MGHRAQRGPGAGVGAGDTGAHQQAADIQVRQRVCGAGGRPAGQVEGQGAFKNSSFVENVENPVGILYPKNNNNKDNNANSSSFSILKERETFNFEKNQKSKL